MYEQIVDQIRQAIWSGDLPAGTPLPSLRRLARDLEVSLITTTRAYNDLAAAGLIGSLLMGHSGNEGRAFALHFVGIAFAVVFIFAAMAPNVMRSSVDPAYSLTIQQAASADTTLLIMSVAAAVFVPGVLAYTIWSYKVFASRISVESINPDQGGLHPTLVRDSTQPEAHFGY